MASISKNLSVAAQVRRINRDLLKVADLCETEILETEGYIAVAIASEIKSLAPVDDGSDTPGALKESVRVEAGEKKGRKVVLIKAGGTATKDNGKRPYDHARANEFGTEKMKAQPFFFPVWRARRKEARKIIKAAVKRAVCKVSK
jgi:HK97 gp10 family phage protein